MNSYHFFLITFIVFISYFFTLFLVKQGTLKLFKQRQIWNTLLLLTFLISGLLGLILAFSIDQKLSLTWYLPLLWWHVEAGIVMALLSLFHTFWHLKYFQALINKN